MGMRHGTIEALSSSQATPERVLARLEVATGTMPHRCRPPQGTACPAQGSTRSCQHAHVHGHAYRHVHGHAPPIRRGMRQNCRHGSGRPLGMPSATPTCTTLCAYGMAARVGGLRQHVRLVESEHGAPGHDSLTPTLLHIII